MTAPQRAGVRPDRALTVLTAVILLLCCSCADNPPSEFADDFETGVIDEQRWQIDKKGDCEIDVVQAPESGAAIRFRADNNARCEIVPRVFSGVFGDQQREPYREDRWYSFRVYLEEPWKESPENEVLAQWHSTRDKFLSETRGRGPPLALRVIGGYFRISFGWDPDFRSKSKHLARYTLWYSPVITGRWVEWTMRIRWSYGDDGITQIWRDGDLIVDRIGPNTYNDLRGVYLKLGSYHPHAPRTVLFDDISIGNADPRAGSGSSGPLPVH